MSVQPPLPDNAFSRLGTTIFSVMSALALEHNAVNLGQGFPDEDGQLSIREAAARALIDGPNQYPPMPGLPVLRQALARHAKRHYDLDFDWQSEIVVTSGATEALYAAITHRKNDNYRLFANAEVFAADYTGAHPGEPRSADVQLLHQPLELITAAQAEQAPRLGRLLAHDLFVRERLDLGQVDRDRFELETR